MEAPISLRLPQELIHRIDRWRESQMAPPSRQVAIRAMLDQWLRQHATPTPERRRKGP
jgi:Arc/MetJ-type ribon-helix-helix transcriptional regulator